MKFILLVTLISVFNQAYALQCSFRTNTPNTVDYGTGVFEGLAVLKDGATSQTILIKPDNTLVENFDSQATRTIEELTALDGSKLANIIKTNNGGLWANIGIVDISKPSKFIFEAGAVSADGASIYVMNLLRKHAFTCYTFFNKK